ncbi:hypothetical protein EMIT0373P_50712 [Pseudomonas chlororaphis]
MSYNGITPASQADNEGSIPFTRSTSPFRDVSTQGGRAWKRRYYRADTQNPLSPNRPRLPAHASVMVLLGLPRQILLKHLNEHPCRSHGLPVCIGSH